MVEPIPVYAQEVYAVLYNRFKERPFDSNYLRWFISEPMMKKTLHVLEKKGWIRRLDRGSYCCINPDKVFRDMVRLKVPELLSKANKPYAYAKVSAAEIWTDFSYMQRSWEHSPYFIKVLKKDLNYWVEYLRSHKIKSFVKEAKPALGEFVVLLPEERLSYDMHNGKPVEKLVDVVKFCEENIETFEYPLAYLIKKYKIKSSVDMDIRVLQEAAKAI